MTGAEYERSRKQAQDREYYLRNIEKCRAKSLAYYYAHREEANAKTTERRRAKRAARKEEAV